MRDDTTYASDVFAALGQGLDGAEDISRRMARTREVRAEEFANGDAAEHELAIELGPVRIAPRTPPRI